MFRKKKTFSMMICVCFSSGYDFGYLLKMLTGKLLPDTENDFFELLKIFFPTIYDVKYLMKSCKNLKGGLEEVAKQLEVQTFTSYFSQSASFAILLDRTNRTTTSSW